MATFHAFSKLQLHSETTVNILEYGSTRDLGIQLRHFKQEVCDKLEVTETPRETSARYRREAKAAGKASVEPATAKGKKRQMKKPENNASKRRKITKKFNLSTYKLHALGDYSHIIRRFGTTDSYTTQNVSSAYFIL